MFGKNTFLEYSIKDKPIMERINISLAPNVTTSENNSITKTNSGIWKIFNPK